MLKKILLSVLSLVVAVVGGGLAFLSLRSPDMAPASSKKVASTPERIERGKYLFSTAGCADCHSQLDPTRFAGPVVPGGFGKGQILPGPGRIVAPNLTSDPETGAARFSDGQLLRAIREGIGHDDRVLFPMMPYSEYRNMSDEDVESVIAFIRTIPPVRNPQPKTEIMFPVNLFIKGYPKPVGSVAPINRADTVAYGKYLSRISGCYFCHTPLKSNQPIEEKAFSGGHEFKITDTARAVAPNLTPDPDTGLGKWSEQQFLDKFAEYKTYAQNGSPKIDPELNTAMPWVEFSKYETADLKALYAYLRTVPAISNGVVTHPDAPEEKRKRK